MNSTIQWYAFIWLGASAQDVEIRVWCTGLETCATSYEKMRHGTFCHCSVSTACGYASLDCQSLTPSSLLIWWIDGHRCTHVIEHDHCMNTLCAIMCTSTVKWGKSSLRYDLNLHFLEDRSARWTMRSTNRESCSLFVYLFCLPAWWSRWLMCTRTKLYGHFVCWGKIRCCTWCQERLPMSPSHNFHGDFPHNIIFVWEIKDLW